MKICMAKVADAIFEIKYNVNVKQGIQLKFKFNTFYKNTFNVGGTSIDKFVQAYVYISQLLFVFVKKG